MKKVFMFPGQGSQKVGMGKDFYDSFPAAKKRFDEANDILARDLKAVIFEGPDQELQATRNTQPALFTMEAAVTDVLREKGMTPLYTLGHSLGEYGALYAAGVVSFADGLKIVARRGELMAQAGARTKGTMAAVIGLSRSAIEEVLSQVTEGVVVAANDNSPDQIVISGDVSAIESAGQKLGSAGAKRVIKLPVSGAFHSPLMQPAADEFEQYIASFTFSNAACPVITNVTAKPENDAQTLKTLLVRQLLSPVRWVDSIRCLKELNAFSALEVGPGSVLKGLVRKCCDQINVVSCDTVENLYSCMQ